MFGNRLALETPPIQLPAATPASVSKHRTFGAAPEFGWAEFSWAGLLRTGPSSLGTAKPYALVGISYGTTTSSRDLRSSENGGEESAGERGRRRRSPDSQLAFRSGCGGGGGRMGSRQGQMSDRSGRLAAEWGRRRMLASVGGGGRGLAARPAQQKGIGPGWERSRRGSGGGSREKGIGTEKESGQGKETNRAVAICP